MTTPEKINVKQREMQKSREESGRVLHYLKLPGLSFLLSRKDQTMSVYAAID